ncbi:MAG: sulfatase-like hydrolase/transferase [Verrucomicrobia bacterium]|nr:sulfatase-like hydrolase/transferase [Verrucomicrobiota bacterium]
MSKSLLKIACLMSLLVCGARAEERPPNVVFLFADDLGYGDLACYGHPYAKTPALDKLATEGTRFTQSYAGGQTCSPSRTAIMTGRTWWRFSKSIGWNGFGERVTVTELLNNAGYATGHFGKWHIGPQPYGGQRLSGVYGIDEYDRCGPTDIYKQIIPEGRDAPIYDRAIEFIKENKDRPFYVNVWGFSTHAPVFAHPDHLAEFEGLEVDEDEFSEHMQIKFRNCEKYNGDINRAMQNYLADLYALDLSVKKILDAIDEMGLSDNTIVVFASDQGPADIKINDDVYNKPMEFKEHTKNMIGCAGPFRGGKHKLFEGGLRVPFIVRWPGKVKANTVDSESVFCGVDWLPTICKLAGVEAPTDIDGEDVSDMWLGAKKRARRKSLIWSGYPGPSIRERKWRYYKGKYGELLYDISKDPGETDNLIKQYPEVADRLRKKVAAWLKELPKLEPKPKKKKKKALPGLAGCFLLMPGEMWRGNSVERPPPACLVGE